MEEKARNIQKKEKYPLSSPAKVTIPWLLKHVPATLWLTFLSLILASYSLGIKTSNIELIREFYGLEKQQMKMPNIPIEEFSVSLVIDGWIETTNGRNNIRNEWNNFNITIPFTGTISDFMLTAKQLVNGRECARNSITLRTLNFPPNTSMNSTTEIRPIFQGGCQIKGNVIQCFFDKKDPSRC